MSMEAKASLRNINYKNMNKVLFPLILLIGLWYWEEILWSAFSFKEWMNNDIRPSTDEQLCLDAKERMERGESGNEILAALNGSLAINPVGEGVFLLGEYYFSSKEDDKATVQFEKKLSLDPYSLEAYLRLSSIHERNRRPAESKKILQKGIGVFRKNAPKFIPRPDSDSPWQYNAKSTDRYEEYLKAAETLSDELRKIKPTGNARRF